MNSRLRILFIRPLSVLGGTLLLAGLASCDGSTGPDTNMLFHIEASCPGFAERIPRGCEIPVGATVQVVADGVLNCIHFDCINTIRIGCEVSWTSSDPGVAPVSEEGLVRGVSKGSATITATGDCHSFGPRSASIEIVVTEG